MEFPFDVHQLVNRQSITVWDRSSISSDKNMGILIDKMGAASAKAQGLCGPITTMEKFKKAAGHKIYLCVDEKNRVMGFLKTGIKHLFYMVRGDFDVHPHHPKLHHTIISL